MKSRLALLLFATAAFFILSNRAAWKQHSIISWDASGYYIYLPSVFINHDLATLDVTDSVRYHYAEDVPSYGIARDSITGRRACKYPLGTALLEAPFFCAVHYLIQPFSSSPRDGFSAPYQIGFACASIIWVLVGLAFLRRLLLRYFTDGFAAITLLVLAFGTNLYHFTIFQPGWSHPYSFFLYCCLMEQTDAWKSKLKGEWRIIIIGFLLGLIIITRPTNIIAVLIPLLWPSKVGTRIKYLSLYWLLALITFAAVCFVQMSYWHYTTGHWIHYSYGEEHFDFLHPHIWQGLFSYRKGWFVYTPVAFIMLAGIPFLYRREPRWLWLCGLITMLQVYIVFSWRIWHYGGGFSSRPMVDFLPVLALPLAAIITYAWQRRPLKVLSGLVLGLCIALNMFQTYQYSIGVIHYSGMTRAYYWRTFGRLKVEDEDRQLLLEGGRGYYIDEDDK